MGFNFVEADAFRQPAGGFVCFRQPAVSRIRPPSPYQTDALVVSRTVYKVCFTRYGAEWYVRGFNPQAALRLSVPL